jgi:hypothetical protein
MSGIRLRPAILPNTTPQPLRMNAYDRYRREHRIQRASSCTMTVHYQRKMRKISPPQRIKWQNLVFRVSSDSPGIQRAWRSGDRMRNVGVMILPHRTYRGSKRWYQVMAAALCIRDLISYDNLMTTTTIKGPRRWLHRISTALNVAVTRGWSWVGVSEVLVKGI